MGVTAAAGRGQPGGRTTWVPDTRLPIRAQDAGGFGHFLQLPPVHPELLYLKHLGSGAGERGLICIWMPATGLGARDPGVAGPLCGGASSLGRRPPQSPDPALAG